jgi:DNA repair protein RadC
MDETRIKLVNIKPIDDIQITKPTDCIDFMKRTIGDMSSEFFAVIYLNNANEPMCFHIVSKGGWKAASGRPEGSIYNCFTAGVSKDHVLP